MKLPSKEQVERVRAEFPVGTRIELPNGIDDEYSPLPPGTRGTVIYVDDMLNIGAAWDCGGSLNAIYGHDAVRKLIVVTDTLKTQIQHVRRGGKTNMLDVYAVQYAANEEKLYELAYVEIPKKMGKSELAAAVALLLTCGDFEHGGEV